MDISSKKSRADIKAYFKKNSVPTESNFAELIGSSLNQKDDGITRPPGDPLSIEASTQVYKPALNFYEEFTDASPSWAITLASTSGSAGFAIGNPPKNQIGIDARIFIERDTGNVGVGTVSPASRLDVEGGIKAKSAVITGAASVGAALEVALDVTAKSALHVVGAASLGGGASITGALETDSALVNGAFKADSASVTGAFDAGSAAITSSLSAGSAAITNSLSAGSAAVQKTLSAGAATVTGAITADSAAVTNGLSAGSGAITGAITAGSATIKGALQAAAISAQSDNAVADLTIAAKGATGAVRVTSALSADSTLGIAGKITAGGALDVAGAVTAKSTLDVTGKVTAAAALDVAGAVTAKSTLDITGKATAASGIDVWTVARGNPDDHPKGRPLYVTGDIKNNQGVEIRTTDATQGIGIGPTTIYAAGSSAVQELVLTPKGTTQSPAKVRIEGALEVQSALSASGAISGASLSVTGAISGASAAVGGAFTAGSAAVTGALSAASVAVTGAISGGSASVTGSLAAASASLSGALSAGTLKIGADGLVVSKITDAITADTSPVAIPTMTAVRTYVAAQASSSAFPSDTSEDTRHATVVAVKAFVNQAIPIGGIIMWSGLIKDLPSNWSLCDGSGGKTPNLQNRFILGSGTRSAGTTGGSETVTLTQSQIPAHNHAASTGSDGSHTHTFTAYDDNFHHAGSATESQLKHTSDGSFSVTTASAGSHNHTVTVNNTGGDAAHDNMPPYYVLAYIMRMS